MCDDRVDENAENRQGGEQGGWRPVERDREPGAEPVVPKSRDSPRRDREDEADPDGQRTSGQPGRRHGSVPRCVVTARQPVRDGKKAEHRDHHGGGERERID
jgi:hypothetical protein